MEVKTKAVVFTDLDGTLLDEEHYSFEPALDAIERLKAQSIPIIFCSSKTRQEIGFYRKKIGITDPFIVENGGAIYIPQGYFPHKYSYDFYLDGYDIIRFGLSYFELARKLKEIKQDLDIDIICFSELSPQEISNITGLSLLEARLSKQREYDEPFLLNHLNSKEKQLFFAEIKKRGLQFTEGNIFFHLQGDNDKGKATRKLMDIYCQASNGIVSIALGDSLNDLPMLKSVDIPILIRKKDSTYKKEIEDEVLGISIPTGAGPIGWNNAILDWINSHLKK